MADYIWDGSEDWSGKKFEGNFIVRDGVSSLKGCPKEVTGYFQCSSPNVKSLKYMPKIIHGDIYLDYSGIENLEGMPKDFKGRLYVKYCENLTSLKGIPKHLYSLNVSGCPNLKSLNCELEVIDDEMDCSETGIVEFNSNLKAVYKFECNSCENLKSIKGSPKFVHHMQLKNNKNLTSLEGAPEIIQGDLYLNKSGIKNLIGMPKKIEGTLVCAECDNLTSLKGIAQQVRYAMFLENKSLKVIDDLPQKFNSIDFNSTPIEDITLNAIYKLGTNFSSIENVNENVMKKIRKFAFILLNYPKFQEVSDEKVEKIDKIFFKKS